MISLTKKQYICNSCGAEGKILLAIKRNADLCSDFPSERIEDFDTLTEHSIYTYEIVRDESGITLYKHAVKVPCDSCKSKNISWVPGDNENNVLNFYPDGEPAKWFRGFQDLSK